MFLKNEFSNRLVQISLFAGIVYYITAYPVVFESARKYFPIKFKKTHHLLIFHTFVFAVLMYVLTYFVFDPLVKVVEGAGHEGGDGNTTVDLQALTTSSGAFGCNDDTKREPVGFTLQEGGGMNCSKTLYQMDVSGGGMHPRNVLVQNGRQGLTIKCAPGYNFIRDPFLPPGQMSAISCAQNEEGALDVGEDPGKE